MMKTLSKNKYDISMIYRFLKCPHCFMILSDLSLTEIKKKCPNCGKVGPREIFPRVSQIKIIEMIQSTIQNAELKYDKQIENLVIKMKVYTQELNTKESIESLLSETKDWGGAFDEQIRYFREKYELSEEKAVKMVVDLTLSTQVTLEHKYTVILAITLFESFFSQLLKDLIIKNEGTYKLAEDIVDILFSYKAYLDLFSKLTKDSFEKALGNVKTDKDYYKKLEVLKRERNNFVHGDPWAISRADACNAFDFALSSVRVFKELNNKYCAVSKI